MPELSDVTLVAVTSVALPSTLEALKASMRQAKFGDVLLLSNEPPSTPFDGIKWRQIDRLNSRSDYSQFMLRELANHITTTHAICAQWDGYVLDGDAWDPDFLNYDYIGAVWPQFHDDHNVGNGGFSLRSVRLLRACRNLPFDRSEPEDVLICRVYRDRLEGKGIRFAPECVARRFSFERSERSGEEFGFHGSFNLVQLVGPSDADQIFGSLEPGMLAHRERLELLRWAIRHRRPKLAWIMLKRLI